MDSLESAGLTENESKIYKKLLLLKKANVTDLAKKTGVHRRSVYDVLMRLSEKGLVSHIIDNEVRVYIPNNPKALRDILEAKKQALEQTLPELEKLFHEQAETKSTKFFMGKKGIRQILESQLEQKQEILVLGGNPKAPELLKEYFPRYHLIRLEKKIPMKIIFSAPSNSKNNENSKTNKIPKIPLCKSKQMPKGMGGDIAINIYDNNVALLMWNHENPFAILIHEKEVADSFRDYFNFIWEKI